MNKFIKSLAITCVVTVFSSTAVLAQDMLSKDEAKAQVVNACQTEAKKRYGEESVHHIGNKVKWMKAMGGAAVKIKIKPQSKRVVKYSCVLQKDEVVKFYKT